MQQPEKQSTYANIRCLLVDLDDTLYPYHTGVWGMAAKRIDQFLVEEIGVQPADVKSMRERLFTQYGTTLRGLLIENKVDMDHYLDYVHDIPIDDLLAPDPELDQMFHTLPQRKVIFTNASTDHAKRVLRRLGIQHHFERIIDIYDIFPFCKPQVGAYHTTLDIIKEQPEHCLMIDDNARNLATARSLGISTVIVGPQPHDGNAHINEIKELGRLLTP